MAVHMTRSNRFRAAPPGPFWLIFPVRPPPFFSGPPTPLVHLG
jgi:hypothetical protein